MSKETKISEDDLHAALDKVFDLTYLQCQRVRDGAANFLKYAESFEKNL